MTSPTDPDRFNSLAERSKNDREMIVGSEVREVIQAYKIVCKLLAARREDHLTACKIASDAVHEQAAAQDAAPAAPLENPPIAARRRREPALIKRWPPPTEPTPSGQPDTVFHRRIGSARIMLDAAEALHRSGSHTLALTLAQRAGADLAALS